MSVTTFNPGDRVTILKNDARVTPGSRGIVIGHVGETGLPLVDVEGRGRVSLMPDSLELISGLPAVRIPLEESIVSSEQPVPKKRTMIPEHRARISEAQQERQRRLREAKEQAPPPDAVVQVAPAANIVAVTEPDDAATMRAALSIAARRGVSATALVELAQLLSAIESAA